MAQSAADHLTPHCVGSGQIEPLPNGVRLLLPGTPPNVYSDSQLDDFHGRARRDYRWRPPVTLSLRARFSHPATGLRGTAGFGWWNNPFAADRAMLPTAAPKNLWFFFASPPANLALTGAWAGQGWFAQSLNVPTLFHFAGALGALLIPFPKIHGVLERAATRLTHAAEQPLPELDITQWHEYRINWQNDHAAFFVDNNKVLHTHHPSTGPLAIVIWMDNQWADTKGRSGVLDVTNEQWMDVKEIQIWHEYSH
jgi:hypothetical protein